MKNLVKFMKEMTDDLHAGGQFGTAHVYKSSLRALIEFHGSTDIPFREVDREFLKKFEVYLRGKKRSWNTVSTYMRMLRSVYNRAVDQKKAPYVPHLFRCVYTGTKADKKRALGEGDMVKLFDSEKALGLSPALSSAKDMFLLMFFLRGLPFVDLVYLRKEDVMGNMITYRRRKTGRLLSVTLTPEAAQLIDGLKDRDSSSPYLFPLLTHCEGSRDAYSEYQQALRSFNNRLLQLGQTLGLESKLSSYTARHSWATMAYYCEVHPGIISEAMGHSSITVTETYLKPFQEKRIDDANRAVIASVRQLCRLSAVENEPLLFR